MSARRAKHWAIRYLPENVVEVIAEHADIATIFAMSRVSRAFRRASMKQTIGRNLTLDEFHEFPASNEQRKQMYRILCGATVVEHDYVTAGFAGYYRPEHDFGSHSCCVLGAGFVMSQFMAFWETHHVKCHASGPYGECAAPQDLRAFSAEKLRILSDFGCTSAAAQLVCKTREYTHDKQCRIELRSQLDYNINRVLYFLMKRRYSINFAEPMCIDIGLLRFAQKSKVRGLRFGQFAFDGDFWPEFEALIGNHPMRTIIQRRDVVQDPYWDVAELV